MLPSLGNPLDIGVAQRKSTSSKSGSCRDPSETCVMAVVQSRKGKSGHHADVRSCRRVRWTRLKSSWM